MVSHETPKKLPIGYRLVLTTAPSRPSILLRMAPPPQEKQIDRSTPHLVGSCTVYALVRRIAQFAAFDLCRQLASKDVLESDRSDYARKWLIERITPTAGRSWPLPKTRLVNDMRRSGFLKSPSVSDGTWTPARPPIVASQARTKTQHG